MTAPGAGSPTTRVESAAQHRARLLRGVPVTERRLEVAGVPTAVLEGGPENGAKKGAEKGAEAGAGEGGGGRPVVLLHGPGESAVNWRWTLPGLAATHRVIAPDLPAHGASGTGDEPLGAGRAVAWLDALIAATCDQPPVVVGHVLGGAIAARFAADRPGRLRRLVLVDSLGLGRFHPSPGFALTFAGFMARPRERSYERFMGQCAYDLDELRSDLGDDWSSFVAYNLAMARSETASEAGRLFRAAGLPRIPADELERIDVPTALIWGREDRANRLRVAERASARFGWPLHVIDRAADDPARDQPASFLEALRATL